MKNLKEIDRKTFTRFETMQELVNSMRRNVKVWTWGAHAFTNFENLFLRFKVNGHLFKGWVYIGVNGKDLFDVFFTNRAQDIIHECNDVYVDELISRIDEKVEKIPGYKW